MVAMDGHQIRNTLTVTNGVIPAYCLEDGILRLARPMTPSRKKLTAAMDRASVPLQTEYHVKL